MSNYKIYLQQTTIVLLLTSMLFACSRQNARTGEEETNTATKAAIGGAIAGALAGVATGKKNGALFGAVGGAAIGGGVGYYFDQQEAALRKELVDSGVQVKRVGENELQLIMSKGIGFESAGYNLTNSIFPSLNSVAKVLNEYPESSLLVSGYTDSSGSEDNNMKLSKLRAESVQNYLVKQEINAKRINTIGYGEKRPVASNKDALGRKQNRRVEITITAK